MPGSVVRLFRPQLFTAGACGPRDRRNQHSSPPTIIRTRRYGDSGGAQLPLFAATMVTDAEFPSTGDGAIGTTIGAVGTIIIVPPPSLEPSENTTNQGDMS